MKTKTLVAVLLFSLLSPWERRVGVVRAAGGFRSEYAPPAASE